MPDQGSSSQPSAPSKIPVAPESSHPSTPSTNDHAVHADKKGKLILGIGILSAVVAALAVILFVVLFFQSPKEVVGSFIRDGQRRNKVNTSVFLNQQAEQRFAIVYKIPPKSFKIKRTIIEEKTATVEVEWTAVDSSHGYQDRTDTVSFILQKDKQRWKLDDIKNGSVLDYNFLFGI